MSDNLKSKIKELEEKVRLLEIENSDWTDRAEDVFLFATTAESISKLTDEKKIFETALEKISIMKNIPYCAFGTLGNGKVNIEYEYASFTEEEKIAKIVLSPSLKKEVVERKIVVEKYNKPHSEIEIEFNQNGFVPQNILIIYFYNYRNTDGIFICVDKEDEDRLDTIRDTLRHSVTLVNNRIDNIFLMRQLSERNTNLEMRVAESTGELEEEIKEHIRTEEALLKSEIMYRTLFEKSSDAIYIVEKETGRYLNCNNAAEKLFGRTLEKIKQLTIYDIAPENAEDRISKVISEEGAIDFGEVTYIRKDGSKRTALLSSVPIGEDSIFGIARDITDRKNMEIALRDSEDKMKSVFRVAPTGIGVVKDRVIIEINPRVCEITGYTKEELIGKNALFLYPNEEEYEFVGREKYNQIKEYGTGVVETKWLKKDKKIIDVLLASTPIDQNNLSKGVTFTALDITERKKTERELIESKKNAEKADKMKSIFLAQMSHEIRTPINALVSMSSLLRYDFEETANEDQLMSFDIIDRAGGRIIRTVDLLLNLSEIQAGTYDVSFTKFDVFTEVISQIVAEHKMIAKNKKIKLNLIYSVSNSELVADHYTVTQIFTQLIDNSIKYTEEGFVTVKILRNELEQLVVEVKDTGVGIEQNYLPHIFDAFSQEEMGYTRKFEGNGIGLTLVKTYCELNNAKINVESKKGVGSVFRITFNA